MLLLFGSSLLSIVWCSTTTKDFYKTRSPIIICIQWTRSNWSLLNLFLALSSFRLSMVLFISDLIFFWHLKCLSALRSCFISLSSHSSSLFFFMMTFISILVAILWLRCFHMLCFSIILCIYLLMRKKYSFFYWLWAFYFFELIWSLAHYIYRWCSIWFLIRRLRRHLQTFLGSLRTVSLEIAISNSSSVILTILWIVFFIHSFLDSSCLTCVFGIEL